MAYQHKENSGSLFKNKEKKSEKQPDYQGTANFEGTIIRLAGWIRTTETGTFLSLKLSRPEDHPQRGGPRPYTDESTPF